MAALHELTECFLECAVHMWLYTRQIYLPNLFEQRRFIGITVWQCRHPDVIAYIKRVFANMKPLLYQNLLEKLVLVTLHDGKPLDHTIIKIQVLNGDSVDNASSAISLVEEELRSCLLRLSMLESSLKKLPIESEDFTWTIMAVTNPCNDVAEEETLSKSLTCGDWRVDNNQLSENVALSQRVSNATESAPRLLPLKTYRDDNINLSMYAHSFS